MANQPPTARPPFIRLPYFGRQPPAQPPPPRPAARPPIARPGFAQALRPNPPPPPPPPVQLRPPITSPIISSPSMPSPIPRDSPVMMNTRSPSPISLPPSQLQASKGEAEHRITLAEADQKTVVDKQVVYSTTPKGSPVKGFGSTYKEDGGAGVVSMAGENKGAVMELGRNANFPHNHVSDDSESESDDEEDGGRGRLRRVPRNAYVNSNVQGVNDSILYNCSITHHDPGVHFSLSRSGYSYSNGNGIKHHGNGKWH